MDLLRFSTAGSVDDGKSTLIGRLLYDSKGIFEDQLQALERTSAARGNHQVDLALLTDGLRAEREQGITIDVAYRYFATPKRKFIIADTPGHQQYTRNMVTGASTADLAIILVDARKGMTEQSRRHATLSSLLRVPHVVLAVNKMDLVGWSEERFNEIYEEFTEFSAKLDVPDLTAIPLSALLGDNVVDRSVNMPWYGGASLMHHLEHVHIASDRNLQDVRFPVQYVIRPMRNDVHDYRGFAGQVASGTIRVGDEVMALPSGMTSKMPGKVASTCARSRRGSCGATRTIASPGARLARAPSTAPWRIWRGIAWMFSSGSTAWPPQPHPPQPQPPALGAAVSSRVWIETLLVVMGTTVPGGSGRSNSAIWGVTRGRYAPNCRSREPRGPSSSAGSLAGAAPRG